MKKAIWILATLAALAVPIMASAGGPYLVCSKYTYTAPNTGDTLSFNVTGLPAAITATNIPPDPTGTYGFALNLAGIPVGTYTVSATACNNDAVWGQQCSAASPNFTFTVPAALSAPGTISISTTQ